MCALCWLSVFFCEPFVGHESLWIIFILATSSPSVPFHVIKLLFYLLIRRSPLTNFFLLVSLFFHHFLLIYVGFSFVCLKKQLNEVQQEHCLLVTLTNLSFQQDLTRHGRLLLLPSLGKQNVDWVPSPVHLPSRHLLRH